MNRLLFNSGTLNGAIYGLVLATASVVCSSNVGAAAVRVAKAEAALTGLATASPQATYTQKASSSILGSAGLFPAPTHQQQSSASLQGSGNVLVYVLREIGATASLTTSANIIAVVASTQGSASIAGTTSVTASGTRIQAVTSTLAAQADVLGVALLTRRPTAVVEAQALVRAEATRNRAIEGYVDSSGSGTVTALALCTRPASGVLQAQATGSAVGTLIQPGKANSPATGFVFLAEPYVQSTLICYLTATGSVQASAGITQLPIASLESQATVLASLQQTHAAKSDCLCTVGVLAAIRITSPISADVVTHVTVEGQATRELVGEASTVASANIAAVANSTSLAFVAIAPANSVQVIAEDLNTRRLDGVGVFDSEASMQAMGVMTLYVSAAVTPGQAFMSAVADTTYRNAEASITGNSASLVANPEVTRYSGAAFLAMVEIAPMAVRSVSIYAQVQGTGLVYADTIANPESIDPDERTFSRPFTEVNFVRPFIETEFKRAA